MCVCVHWIALCNGPPQRLMSLVKALTEGPFVCVCEVCVYCMCGRCIVCVRVTQALNVVP